MNKKVGRSLISSVLSFKYMVRRISSALAAVFLLFTAGTLLVSPGTAQKSTSVDGSAKVDFVRDIQPIFQKSCLMCHGPQTQMAGLRLDAKQSVMSKVVVPRKSAESHLYQRVAGIGGVT